MGVAKNVLQLSKMNFRVPSNIKSGSSTISGALHFQKYLLFSIGFEPAAFCMLHSEHSADSS